MARPLKRDRWCDICRDDQPDVVCSRRRACKRAFHYDCLLNTGQHISRAEIPDYVCSSCRENDAAQLCVRCNKHVQDEDPGDISSPSSQADDEEKGDARDPLYCEECGQGAHPVCADLLSRGGVKKPEGRGSDEWVCPRCEEKIAARAQRTMLARPGGLRGAAGGAGILGNMDICYVCQKGGKLLCCDTCEQSFHPTCVDPEMLELTTVVPAATPAEGDGDASEGGREPEERWSCPICRGKDPLQHMQHKRMTKADRQERAAACQQCIREQGRTCRLNRDLFLWQSRAALEPFVTPAILAKLRKNAAAAKKIKRLADTKRGKWRGGWQEDEGRSSDSGSDSDPSSDSDAKNYTKSKKAPERAKLPDRTRKGGRESVKATVSSKPTPLILRQQASGNVVLSARQRALRDKQQQQQEEAEARAATTRESRQRRRAVPESSSGEESERSNDHVNAGSVGRDASSSSDSATEALGQRSSRRLAQRGKRLMRGVRARENRIGKFALSDDDDGDEINGRSTGAPSEDRNLRSRGALSSKSGLIPAVPDDSSPSLASLSSSSSSTSSSSGEESEGGHSCGVKGSDDGGEAKGRSEEDVKKETPIEDQDPISAAVMYRDTSLLEAAEKKIEKNKKVDKGAESRVDEEIPSSLLKEGVSLKDYQRWGVNWLLDAFYNKAGAILADEMGLGKTIQTLAFISALRCLGITGPHLVVVPLSTVGNWAREIRRFSPFLTCTKICGSLHERQHSMQDPVSIEGIYDLYITTYETCVTEEWFFTDCFKWQCVILDEAHRIKNDNARIRHSLDRVACNMRVLLTGTPLQNNIRELFTLLNFLFPDVLRSSGAVESKLFAPSPPRPPTTGSNENGAPAKQAQPVESSAVMSGFAPEQVEAITTLLARLMLRRTKDLVVRLPKKIEREVWLPLSPVALFWYKRLLEMTADVEAQDQSLAVSSGPATSLRKLLGAVIKMRVVCCHPRGLVATSGTTTTTGTGTSAGLTDQGLATEEEAAALKKVERGWRHVLLSSKLVFLDKLLRQLHAENMRHCEAYREDFEASLAARYQSALSRRREKLEQMIGSVVASTAGSKVKGGKRAGKGSRQGNGAENSNAAPAVAFDEASISAIQFSEEALAAFRRMRSELELLETKASEGVEAQSAALCQVEAPAEDKEEAGTEAETSDLFKDLMSDAPTSANASSSIGEEGEASSAKGCLKPHKVLIFTQFQLALTELEAYCQWRGWSYMRLDGSTNKMIRELDTREFNSPHSNHLVYLISTRAGGLGINLVTANHVVLFDEDWNPFIDMQAVDRAHRIGQTRPVSVWKLITEWTVEERMAIRRQQKLKLDRLLIQANVAVEAGSVPVEPDQDYEKLSTEEVRRLLQYGRAALLQMEFNGADDPGIASLALPDLIKRGRRELSVAVQEKSETDGEKSEDMVSVSVAGTPPPGSTLSVEDEEVPPTGEGGAPATTPALTTMTDDEAMSVASGAGRRDEEEPERVAEEGLAGSSSPAPSSTGSKGNEAAPPIDEVMPTNLGGRPRRERKRPKLLYNPVLSWAGIDLRGQRKGAAAATPGAEQRRMMREKNCFKCGEGVKLVTNGAPDEEAVEGGKEDEATAVPEDPLVGCMRCPKVYHQTGCLGFDKIPPRSWMCPWHECCVCFRRAGSAGGMLIHCAECPTAFCFDCFPPEYRRYNPPPSFFEKLQKRGWPVTPQKLVTFLCSRCKALKEQERRRKLSRQQLEAENRQRRTKEESAKQDASKRRKEAQKTERAAVRQQKQKEQDDRKNFLESKKKIDEADRQTQERLRKAVEALYPPRYLQFLDAKRAKYVAENAAHKPSAQPQRIGVDSPTALPPDEAEGGAPLDKASKDDGSAVSSPTQQNSEAQDEGPAANGGGSEKGTAAAETGGGSAKKAPAKRRFILPDRYKRPADLLKLCENCQLPKHDVSTCPFPAEMSRQRIELGGSGTANKDDTAIEKKEEGGGTTKQMPARKKAKTASTSPEVDSEKPNVDASVTPVVIIEESPPAPPPPAETAKAADGQDAKDQQQAAAQASSATNTVKSRFRAVCAVCLKASSKPHSRKHCSDLSEDAKREYDERRMKVSKFLDLLEECAFEQEGSKVESDGVEENSVAGVKAEGEAAPLSRVSDPAGRRRRMEVPSRLETVWKASEYDPLRISDKFADTTRRQFAASADKILVSCLREAGLGACVVEPPPLAPPVVSSTPLPPPSHAPTPARSSAPAASERSHQSSSSPVATNEALERQIQETITKYFSTLSTTPNATASTRAGNKKRAHRDEDDRKTQRTASEAPDNSSASESQQAGSHNGAAHHAKKRCGGTRTRSHKEGEDVVRRPDDERGGGAGGTVSTSLSHKVLHKSSKAEDPPHDGPVGVKRPRVRATGQASAGNKTSVVSSHSNQSGYSTATLPRPSLHPTTSSSPSMHPPSPFQSPPFGSTVHPYAAGPSASGGAGPPPNPLFLFHPFCMYNPYAAAAAMAPPPKPSSMGHSAPPHSPSFYAQAQIPPQFPSGRPGPPHLIMTSLPPSQHQQHQQQHHLPPHPNIDPGTLSDDAYVDLDGSSSGGISAT